MSSSRIFHTRKNMKSAAILKLVTPVTSFVTRTVVIYTLGNIYLGLNGLFTSMLQVLNLAELGVGSAMVFSMYKPIAEEDTELVCALLAFYRRIHRIIGLVILLAGLAAIPFLPRFIKGTVPDGINLTILYLIRLADTCGSYFLFAYRNCLLDASQKRRYTSYIQSYAKILLCIVQVIILLTIRNYYVFCIMIPMIQLIQNFFFWKVSVDMFPQYVCKGKLSRETVIDIANRVSGLFMFKLSHVLRNSFDSIILSAFLGLDILAKYQNYFLIITTVVGITSIFTDSTLASIGNSIAMEPPKKNYRDFVSFQLLFMTAVGVICACMCCVYQPFIRFWAKTENLLPYNLMLLFPVYFFTERMGNICFQYRQASGLWGHDRIRPIVDGITNLTLNYLLVQSIGLAGVMLSTIFCQIVIDSLWGSRILFRHYFTEEKQSKYLGKLLIYAFSTVLACMACIALCSWLPEVGTTRVATLGIILARGIICLCTSTAILIAIYRNLPEYSDSKKIVIRLMTRK